MILAQVADDVHQEALAEGEVLTVYRVVDSGDPDADTLLDCFKSNHAKGRRPRGRERRHPLVHLGLSVFKSPDQAADMRRRIASAVQPGQTVRMGEFVATLALRGSDIRYEDRNEPSGHMTIWASPSRCMECLVDIERLPE